MNSLKNMAKMEEEITVISSIYLSKLHNLIYSSNINSISTSLQYVHRVEEALSSLGEQDRVLINNDFIKPVKPQWWKSIYSSKCYDKLRYKAMSSFLMHFYGF